MSTVPGFPLERAKGDAPTIENRRHRSSPCPPLSNLRCPGTPLGHRGVLALHITGYTCLSIFLLERRDLSPKLIEKDPPPGGGFLFTMFPHQEPWVRGPPRRTCTKCFEGAPLTHGSWWGNIINRQPPWGGGVSFDQSCRDRGPRLLFDCFFCCCRSRKSLLHLLLWLRSKTDFGTLVQFFCLITTQLAL